MDHTLALIGRAHQGDKAARDRLFEENTGLVYSVARRFMGRGTEFEDLPDDWVCPVCGEGKDMFEIHQ